MKIIRKIGNEELMNKKSTLFICSKQTPYNLYPVIFNWVETLDENDCVMCFKSTELEQDVLTALLVRKIPTILFVMSKFTDLSNRQVEKAFLENRLLIVELKRDEPKGAGATSRLRNLFVMDMASLIVAGYVNPNGSVLGLLAGKDNVRRLFDNAEAEKVSEPEKKSSRWTVREDKILLSMFYDDMGVYAIKKKLGRTYLSVVQRIKSITMPDDMLKGREFEDFVLEELLQIGKNDKNAQLVEWRGDKSLGDVFPKSNRFPDFVLSFGPKKKFALECKWRSMIPQAKEKTLLTKEKLDMFEQYQDEKKLPVWFIVGVGGDPCAPEELFFFSLAAAMTIQSGKVSIRNYPFNGLLTLEAFRQGKGYRLPSDNVECEKVAEEYSYNKHKGKRISKPKKNRNVKKQ